ncbi:DNA-binding transcriptional regulator [Porphyromonadaceae bacterium]
MIKLLLLTDFSSGFSRSLIRGVVEYAKKFGPWSFNKVPEYYRELYGEEGVYQLAKEWKADAVIAQIKEIDLDKIKNLGIPILVQNFRERNPMVSNITGDYYQTGVMAANYFIRKGFKHFAFYGSSETVWSQERCNGFVDTIYNEPFEVNLFHAKATKRKDHWNYDPEELRDWLLSLPKPIAVFACDDSFAQHITDTCAIYKIEVPEEVSVLGVDNDDLICSTSNPPLSSIALDVENGGYEVGKLIHRMVEKRLTGSFDVVIKPLDVIERASTDRFAVEDKYLMTVIRYINENIRNPITVEQLVERVPLSRRVLEKQFRHTLNISIYQYILNRRVEMLAQKLITTTLPLAVAAEVCGFPDTKNLSRVFLKIKGTTPLQYRRLYYREK